MSSRRSARHARGRSPAGDACNSRSGSSRPTRSARATCISRPIRPSSRGSAASCRRSARTCRVQRWSRWRATCCGEQWPEFLERGSADHVRIRRRHSPAREFLSDRARASRRRSGCWRRASRICACCNLHRDLRKFVEATSGLVIISGPTGSGKSTTLAALIEEINATSRPPHRHARKSRSSTCSRTASRSSGSARFRRIRRASSRASSMRLRENPDVLVISEMRTPEVMRLTLNAAETGHLVLATMHSSNCAEALSRLCMSFPSDIQASVRAQLADCLVAVCCQRLEFLARARLHVPRCEILLPTSGAKRHDPRRQFQPDRHRAAVGRRGGHVDLRSLSALDGAGDRLGAAAIAAALRGAADGPRVRRRRCGPRRRAAVTRAGAAAGNSSNAPGPGPQPATAGCGPGPADDVIEVPAEEMDLAALAELAKKVVERKP